MRFGCCLDGGAPWFAGVVVDAFGDVITTGPPGCGFALPGCAAVGELVCADPAGADGFVAIPVLLVDPAEGAVLGTPVC